MRDYVEFITRTLFRNNLTIHLAFLFTLLTTTFLLSWICNKGLNRRLFVILFHLNSYFSVIWYNKKKKETILFFFPLFVWENCRVLTRANMLVFFCMSEKVMIITKVYWAHFRRINFFCFSRINAQLRGINELLMQTNAKISRLNAYFRE